METGEYHMKIISHRGNLNGPFPEKENTAAYILKALKVFEVEVDVWYDEIAGLYLGHDEPGQQIGVNFLLENREKLWVHCKNIEALELLKDLNVNCFGHNLDEFVLTSKGHIFTYPHSSQSESSIIVDLCADCAGEDLHGFGVCTDYPNKFHEKN